jgi:aspartate aminotransferase/aminotransferase
MTNLNSIQWLKEIPKKNKNREFIIDDITNTILTFGEFDEKAKNLATILKDHGFSKGDHVSIMMENSSTLAILYFACLYSGIVVIPINPSITNDEFFQITKSSNSKSIFFSDSTISKINSQDLKNSKTSVFCFGKNLTNKNSQEFIMITPELEITQNFTPFYNMNDDDVMSIVYSAGTTAAPKAIVHRIKEFVQNARMFGNMLGINSQNRFCNILSMTYLGGYYNLLILPYVLECSVVLTHTFDSSMAINFWDSIIKHKVNTLWLVPSIMSMLLEIDRDEKGINYCKNNIKLCLAGTAPLSLTLRNEFEKKYNVLVYQNYGLSETFFISSNSPKSTLKEDSVGKILPEINIKIINKNGQEVSGEEGEILVKTPYLMKGYYDLEKNIINEISENTWFETGDFGKISDEGYLSITGRKKDIIIRGGINISPASIENILYEHNSVIDCAVIGIPNKFQGEEIIAVIRTSNSSEFENIKNELYILCKNKISSIKQPTHIVELIEFPRATYGKIQKNKIKSWVMQNKSNLTLKHKIIEKPLTISKEDPSTSKLVSQSIEALSIKFNTEVYEKQRKGEDVIVLSLGEAFFNIPLYKFDDLPYPKIYHYSHSRGIPEIREKLSQYFLDTYDVSFDYEKEIIVTAGSKIAIFMSLMALLNPHDEVIIHEPAWVSFPEQVKLAHGKPIQIPYEKSVYDFEEYVTPKTKLIIINNPNNPTGKTYTLEELSHIYHLAKKYKLYVLSDEAYSDFVLDQNDFISFANLDVKKEHSIVVNSISKNFGISGWRLGYLITNPQLINQILKINQHLITCPATILEYYIANHFDDIIQITKPQIIDLVKKRTDVADYMDSITLRYLPGNTTFYFFVSISPSKLSSEDFCLKLLHENSISVVPGIGYGFSCDKFIRLSIGSESMDRIKKGIDTIKKLITTSS